jgi:hypothetical protein
MLEEAHPTARDTLSIDNNKQWVPAAELLRVLLQTPAAATRETRTAVQHALHAAFSSKLHSLHAVQLQKAQSHINTHTSRQRHTTASPVSCQLLSCTCKYNSLHVHEAQLTTLGYM